MKKTLELLRNNYWYYDDTGKQIFDVNPNVWGDLTDIYGDLTDIYGDLTDVHGDLTDVHGNIDKCELTEEDRRTGINIKNLIKTE